MICLFIHDICNNIRNLTILFTYYWSKKHQNCGNFCIRRQLCNHIIVYALLLASISQGITMHLDLQLMQAVCDRMRNIYVHTLDFIRNLENQYHS